MRAEPLALTAALASVAAVACYHAPDSARPLTATEHAAVQDRVDAWRQAGLDDVGQRCAEQLERWLVVVADDDAMLELTGYCGPPAVRGGCADRIATEPRCRWGCAAASQTRYSDGFFLWANKWPLTVVAEGVEPERALSHEAVHWLQVCTGRGYRGSYHDDPQVWCRTCPGRWRR